MIVSQIVSQLVPNQILYTSPKNFNGELGFPLSILQIESYYPTTIQTLKTLLYAFYKAFFVVPSYDIIILEYGIDHPGEMQSMLDIVIPDIAIWTGLDYVHVSQFENIEHIAHEKAQLVLSAKKLACICIDHPLCSAYVDQITVDCLTFSIATQVGDLHIQLSDIIYTDRWFVSHTQIDVWKNTYMLQSNLILDHDLTYAGLACTIADIVAYQKIGKTIQNDVTSHIINQWGRFNILQGIQKSILIDSTYNATPQSMYTILSQTRQMAIRYFWDYRLVIVLGQMNELGDQAILAHQALAKEIVWHVQDVILYGKSMQDYLGDELISKWYPRDHIHFPQDRAEIIHKLHAIIATSIQPCLILFKGSQSGNYLEECIKPFLYHDQDVNQLIRQDRRWLKKKWISA